jgi:hypothetical protein
MMHAKMGASKMGTVKTAKPLGSVRLMVLRLANQGNAGGGWKMMVAAAAQMMAVG